MCTEGIYRTTLKSSPQRSEEAYKSSKCFWPAQTAYLLNWEKLRKDSHSSKKVWCGLNLQHGTSGAHQVFQVCLR